MNLKIRELEDSDSRELVNENKQAIFRRFFHCKDLSADFLAENFCDNLERRNGQSTLRLGLFDNNGKVLGGVSINVSDWDSKHFGVIIGKTDFLLFQNSVELFDRLRFFQNVKERLYKLNYQLVFIRHLLNDFSTTNSILRAGGIMTDVLLTFHKNVANEGSADNHCAISKIRDARKEDSQAIGDLARRVFRNSHFHSDSRLSLSDDLYVKWSLNSLNGMADNVLIAEENNVLCGFITCNVKRPLSDVEYGVIDLIAVDPRYQKKGIGLLLLNETLRLFPSQTCFYIGTQATNIPAVRLYEKAGFRLVESDATLHFWVTV